MAGYRSRVLGGNLQNVGGLSAILCNFHLFQKGEVEVLNCVF